MDRMQQVGACANKLQRCVVYTALWIAMCIASAVTPSANAEAQSSAPQAQSSSVSAPLVARSEAKLETRATTWSGGFAEVTGLAVSPLVVMALFGAVDWWKLADGASVPLHANPWFWGTLFTIFLIGQIARWTTRPVPMPIRKLFDAVHYLESKCSALLAAGILLPSIVGAMSQVSGDPNQLVGTVVLAPNMVFAGIPEDIAVYLGALTLFAVVWIVSHTIDALVLISPFALLDAALLSGRATILVLLLSATALHPMLGAIVALPLVIFCILVCGWCVRLNLFASTCAWDLLTMRWHRAEPSNGPVRAFLARPRAGLPIRTRGTVTPSGASMLFTYRRWFISAPREIDLGVHPSDLVCGVIWSTFVSKNEQGGGALVAIPPRYRSHEAIIAARFGAERKNGLILRGLAGIRDFFRGIFGRRTPTAAVQ